jgi:CheY-like chemotaxis protein
MVSSGRKRRSTALFQRSILSRRIFTVDGPVMNRVVSRVLMVDEAGLFRMLEASFLRRPGCVIVRAHDAPDLIRKARDQAPSLIVLDTQKAGIDGPACVRELKSDPGLSAIPVLIVTTSDTVAASCDAGADAIVTRPVERGAMELALSSLASDAQRRGRRRSASAWVQVASPHGPRRGRLKDISRTGLFLTLSEPLPLQSRLDLSLRLPGPGGERRLRAQGVVVRQVPRDRDSHLISGVGVQFVEIDASDERHIDHYVGGDGLEAGDDHEHDTHEVGRS